MDEDFQYPATLFTYFAKTFSGSSKSNFLFPITDYAEYYESPQQVIYSKKTKKKETDEIYFTTCHICLFLESKN